MLFRRLRARARRSWAHAVPDGTPPDGLRHCATCSGPHVCPVEWGELDEVRWWIISRCGDCETWSETVISDAQAARLDLELSRQTELIRREADRLDRECMSAQVEAFAAALARDLVSPADFGR
jgi:hypothetical protein